MKYLLYTLIYIIKDWDLSMDEFKPIGKILFWIPMFLNNILRVIFRIGISPLIFSWLWFFDRYQKLVFRFFVYWKQSLNDFIKWIG